MSQSTFVLFASVQTRFIFAWPIKALWFWFFKPEATTWHMYDTGVQRERKWPAQGKEEFDTHNYGGPEVEITPTNPSKI